MKKEIPMKNYILLSIVLILTIVVVTYIFMLFSTKEKNKLEAPILDQYIMTINYNELDNYIVENKDAIIYTSILNNTEIRTFENKFKNIIQKHDINNNILYLDLTKDQSKIKELELKYSKEITMPSLLKFQDGTLKEVYSIKENNYNIKALEKYLEEEDVIND